MRLLTLTATVALPLATGVDLSAQTQPRANVTGARALAESASTNDAPPPIHLMWGPLEYFCLSSFRGQVGVGVTVHLFECDDTWESKGQNMYFDENRRLRMHHFPDYCVVIHGDEFKNGARIVLWSCDDPGKKHAWAFRRRGQIRALGTSTPMCMGVDGNKAVNGAEIQLWSCGARSSNTQDWIQLSLSADGQMMYAEPNDDKACPSPFLPVVHSTADCVAAANIVRPGSGCRFGGGDLLTWAEVVTEVKEPSQPKGCYVYGACQGGCGLFFNPSGFADPSRSGSGSCYYVDVICGLPCKLSSIVT